MTNPSNDSAESSRAIVHKGCGGAVRVEVEFDTGWDDLPVKLRFECQECLTAGTLEDEDFGGNLGELFG